MQWKLLAKVIQKQNVMFQNTENILVIIFQKYKLCTKIE